MTAMSAYGYVVCDVFTDEPLEGNQLAVFPHADAIPEARLQPLAREINFSETVFVYPPGPGADYRIRFFTPKAELPFAGHPILGSAFVLAADRNGDEIRLQTGRGIVPVALERSGSEVRFAWMIQPVPTVGSLPNENALLKALGVERSSLPMDVYDNGGRHVFVALDSEDTVARLRPDMAALERVLGDIGANCFAGAGTRWKTRMFGPGLGIAEDPATGSAAGPLAVHLARHGRIAFDTAIVISQGAELNRPSTLHARVEGSADRIQKVEVGGSAVIVARGEFSLA
jgi:trans-2,3-dihydro-3-hydroxyanthranilate isomerase